jgi:hypothetical protein
MLKAMNNQLDQPPPTALSPKQQRVPRKPGKATRKLARNPEVPGSDTLGATVGAVGAGAAGAAIGSVAGPVGTAVGLAIGALGGAVIGAEVAEAAASRSARKKHTRRTAKLSSAAESAPGPKSHPPPSELMPWIVRDDEEDASKGPTTQSTGAPTLDSSTRFRGDKRPVKCYAHH